VQERGFQVTVLRVDQYFRVKSILAVTSQLVKVGTGTSKRSGEKSRYSESASESEDQDTFFYLLNKVKITHRYYYGWYQGMSYHLDRCAKI
jgi:hypothetical protein